MTKVVVANVVGKQTVCTDNGDGTGTTICALDYVPELTEQNKELTKALDALLGSIDDVITETGYGWLGHADTNGIDTEYARRILDKHRGE